MRARTYDVMWVAQLVVFAIFWATSGEIVWMLLGFMAALFTVRSAWLFTQIRLYASHLISDEVCDSIAAGEDGTFAHCEEIPIDLPEEPSPGKPAGPGRPAIPRVVPVSPVPYFVPPKFWPAVDMMEPGSGRWGYAPILGGNEHGIVIARRDCILDIFGHKVILAHTIVLRPHHTSLLNLLRRMKPTERDERFWLPDEWWRKLKANPRFSVKKSPIYLALDPILPIWTSDAFGNPVIDIPGIGKMDLKAFLPPGTRMLDLRPEFRDLSGVELQKARRFYESKTTEDAATIQKLRQDISGFVDLEDKVSRRERVREQAREVVLGPEESGGRRSG